MDAEAALTRVSAAVVAAFPDRAGTFLDAIERAFRMSRPIGPRGGACLFCGRGQFLRFPFGFPVDQSWVRPVFVDAQLVWARSSTHGAGGPVACLDCAMIACEEFSANPPSAIAERLLVDARRAVSEIGGDDGALAIAALDAAFASMDAPRRVPGDAIPCDLCVRVCECARGPAGGSICEECAGRYWRAIGEDHLTGLETRAPFAVKLHLAIQRARRLSRPLAVLFIDIDHMKSFNDIHGHLAGDALLTRVGGIVRPSLAAGDGLCRYGGEEFAILLPGRIVSEAVRVAEGIRERAIAGLRPPDLEIRAEEAQRHDLAGRLHFPDGCVSVSIGVAGLQPDHDLAELLRAADERVFDAKRTGRNRVCA